MKRPTILLPTLVVALMICTAARAAADESGETPRLSTKMHTEAFYNVRDFGAAGDGVTDDTRAVQSAINAARDKMEEQGVRGNPPMAIVFVPEGTYRITSRLILWANHYFVPTYRHKPVFAGASCSEFYLAMAGLESPPEPTRSATQTLCGGGGLAANWLRRRPGRSPSLDPT